MPKWGYRIITRLAILSTCCDPIIYRFSRDFSLITSTSYIWIRTIKGTLILWICEVMHLLQMLLAHQFLQVLCMLINISEF